MIGSFVCDELLPRGADVVIVDDESKGGWFYCEHLRDKVTHLKGTLEDAEFAKEAIKGADVVFHLASRTCGVGYSNKHHVELFEQNNRVTANVLSAIGQHRPQHVLMTSSSCVYSDDSATPMNDEELWAGEPEMANRGYGWAKRILEQSAELVCSESGVGLTIVRPVNIYGERYHWMGDDSQALPMLTRRVMKGEDPIVIWGSGKQRRSYVHASDCARIMVELVEKGWTSGPVNIGDEATISLPQAVDLIASAVDSNVQLVFDKSKPEGRLIKSASSSRLKHALGITDEPLWKVGIEEGMLRMVMWYRKTFTS